MDQAKDQARVFELQAKIIAIQINVESMKAANEQRKSGNSFPSYSENDFRLESDKVEFFASQLKDIFKPTLNELPKGEK